jgi:hypothetical protein
LNNSDEKQKTSKEHLPLQREKLYYDGSKNFPGVGQCGNLTQQGQVFFAIFIQKRMKKCIFLLS